MCKKTKKKITLWILFADNRQCWKVSVLSGNRRRIGYVVSQDESDPRRWVRNFSREGPRRLFQGLWFITVRNGLTVKSAPNSFRFCGINWGECGNFPSWHRGHRQDHPIHPQKKRLPATGLTVSQHQQMLWLKPSPARALPANVGERDRACSLKDCWRQLRRHEKDGITGIPPAKTGKFRGGVVIPQ